SASRQPVIAPGFLEAKNAIERPTCRCSVEHGHAALRSKCVNATLEKLGTKLAAPSVTRDQHHANPAELAVRQRRRGCNHALIDARSMDGPKCAENLPVGRNLVPAGLTHECFGVG